METFPVTIGIGDPNGQRFEPIEALVDTGATYTIFGDEGIEPLLGVFTLEGFGLGVDAVNERLIPTPGLLKRELVAF